MPAGTALPIANESATLARHSNEKVPPMTRQVADTQNNADGQKKIYNAPQLRDLDSVQDTHGKGSTSTVENPPFSNIS